MARSLKASISQYLSNLGKKNGHANPDRSHNVGNLLGDLFIWDTAKRYCEGQIKSIENIMLREKLVKDKDELRASAKGSYPYDTAVCDSPSFVLHAKVQTPRSSFDKEQFIMNVSQAYKIPKHKLMEMAEDCVKYSAAPVSVSVMQKDS